MEKAKLCKCNNCGTILIDENPQIGAIEHELTGEEKTMIQFEAFGDLYWGCPKCETDDFLIDI